MLPLTVSPGTFTVTHPSCGTQVSASYSFTPIMPFLPNVTLNARSCRPV
jgi:hypothetical protein